MEELIFDYQNQVSNQDLMVKYNLSNYSLIKLLKKYGVYKKFNAIRVSKTIEDYIVNNYFIKSNKELSQELNICEGTLTSIAKKYNMIKGSGWKYNPYVENLNLNSSEFYYYLGWIASDGNVSKDLLRIKLSITDEEIVNKFQELFPYLNIHKYNYNKKKPIYSLTVSSNFLCNHLVSLGIIPNKTISLEVSNNIMNNHFVRGFFEGDGHFRNHNISKYGYKRYEAGFVTASEKFCNQLISYLSSNNIICKVSKEKHYFRIRISGKSNLKNFIDFIYEDCGKWYLKRKKQIADQLFSDE